MFKMTEEYYPTSLFLLTISESGERKSATDKVVLKPINDWQRMLVEQHKKQLTSFKNKFEIWKARRRFSYQRSFCKFCDDIKNLEPEPQPLVKV